MARIKTEAIKSEVHFSKCGHYRWDLIRHFSSGNGTVNFIMLNPSTADANANDPTIARCEAKALQLKFKKMVITNLFGYRSPYPKELFAAKNPIGKDNDKYLLRHARKADLVICAWGNLGSRGKRSQAVKEFLQPLCHLHYLRLNRSGEPAHPLYLPARLRPKPWT